MAVGLFTAVVNTCCKLLSWRPTRPRLTKVLTAFCLAGGSIAVLSDKVVLYEEIVLIHKEIKKLAACANPICGHGSMLEK